MSNLGYIPETVLALCALYWLLVFIQCVIAERKRK